MATRSNCCEYRSTESYRLRPVNYSFQVLHRSVQLSFTKIYRGETELHGVLSTCLHFDAGISFQKQAHQQSYRASAEFKPAENREPAIIIFIGGSQTPHSFSDVAKKKIGYETMIYATKDTFAINNAERLPIRSAPEVRNEM